LSLDYNAAEVRTFIALAGGEQPQEDVHEWHIKNLIQEEISRQEAKVKFFAWIYNHEAAASEFEQYKREQVVERWYDGQFVRTPFKRKIKVDKRKALNYIIQSTTADLVMERAIALDKFLEDKQSFVSHIVHDEVVIDLADGERHLVPEIKDIFAQNKLDTFLVNLTCGKNYGELQELGL
jgi:DNA polymerase I-like protein with 3'-5' exonuclease and polymerase domains